MCVYCWRVRNLLYHNRLTPNMTTLALVLLSLPLHGLSPLQHCLNLFAWWVLSSRFAGSAFLQKELQGVAGFVAFQECHRRGKFTAKAVLEASMAAQYFGDADDNDSIGLTEQLILETGVFSGLYNEEPISTTTRSTKTRTAGTDDGTSTASSALCGSRSTRGEVFVLKPELHCIGKQITVGGASGITMLRSVEDATV